MYKLIKCATTGGGYPLTKQQPTYTIINIDLVVAHPQNGSSSTIPDRIGIWKFWFLRRGGNRYIRSKNSQNKETTNNTLNPHKL